MRPNGHCHRCGAPTLRLPLSTQGTGGVLIPQAQILNLDPEPDSDGNVMIVDGRAVLLYPVQVAMAKSRGAIVDVIYKQHQDRHAARRVA